ncbi:hypothetical protein ACFX13_013750 [Malus domestica]
MVVEKTAWKVSGDGVEAIKAWPFLSIFLGASILTKTLTSAADFSAFGDPIPRLIALAFFFTQDWTPISNCVPGLSHYQDRTP